MSRIDENAKAAFRRALHKTGVRVIFRRISGQAGVGSGVTTRDCPVTAIFRSYMAATPIGGSLAPDSITEGDRQFMVLEDDLLDGGFPVPLLKNDRIVFSESSNETFNIVDIDYGTRRAAGVIEGRARGA
jgi:hypothetical protein